MQETQVVQEQRGAVGSAFMRLGRKFVWGMDRYFGRNSKVGDHPFFDVKDFPWVASVEADWAKVRAELDALLPYSAHMPNFQDISKEQKNLSQDDGWKTFFFYAYGIKAAGNCKRCPETVKALKKIPGMKTAFFSILAPGKHLPPHRGPFKGVLRVHLAVLIPEPTDQCGIRVGTETRHWQEGKVMIFDDTYDHEAWNHTDKQRVVLFVDMLRPCRFPASFFNSCMTWAIAFSPFVLGAAGSYLRWEKRFEDVVNQDAPPRKTA
jgi:beta-hydroxylase